MNYKLIIGIVLALTLIVCAGISVYIYKINELSYTKIEKVTQVAVEKVTDECTKEAEELAMVNSIEKKVSPNAAFIMKTEYKGCGNVIKKQETAPPFTVNLSQNDLQKMYENWKIESFSNNEVVFSKIEEGICKEHYEIGEEEGQIVVYQLDESNNKKVFERTEIIVEYLPEADKAKIEKGIYVHGIDNLNRLIENFE